MNVNVTTIAELAGLAALIVGAAILAGIGGAILAIGTCLLYEARA